MPKRKCSNVDPFLGPNLVYYRKLAGMTQQEVADSIRINRTTYTKYETGVSEPSIEILKRLSKTLKTDIALLLSNAKDSHSMEDFEENKPVVLNSEDRNVLSEYYSVVREERPEVLRDMRRFSGKL